MTNNGLNIIRDLLVGLTTVVRPTFFSMGTSPTLEGPSNTQLGAESAITRKQGTYSSFAKQAILTATLSTSDWVDIAFREVGVFTASSDQLMSMRQTFASLTKPSSPAETWRLDFVQELE